MKTFSLHNGDLQLGIGRRVTLLFGTDKLIQDLELWLAEPLGTSPISPTFGSVLSSMIGTGDLVQAKVRIASEVQRVLGLYQANQFQRLAAAKTSSGLGYWRKSEILARIEKVSVDINHDRAIVTVVIQTLSNNPADQTVTMQVQV